MKYFYFLSIAFILFSCNLEEDNESESSSQPDVKKKVFADNGQLMIDKAFIGMSLQQLKDVYKKAEFVSEPVYEYGIDGESDGIVVENEGQRLFFVWTMDGVDTINGITILSPEILIDSNVHVGMSLKKFMERYPNQPLEIDVLDDRYESILIDSLRYSANFFTTDSTRVGVYNHDSPVDEFIEVQRPEATIDRIAIYRR